MFGGAKSCLLLTSWTCIHLLTISVRDRRVRETGRKSQERENFSMSDKPTRFRPRPSGAVFPRGEVPVSGSPLTTKAAAA